MDMLGKMQAASELSRHLGLKEPDSTGGTFTKEWLAELALACQADSTEVSPTASKKQILRHVVRNLGGAWQDSFVSDGGTVTGAALAHIVWLVELHLKVQQFVGLGDARILPKRQVWLSALDSVQGHPPDDIEEARLTDIVLATVASVQGIDAELLDSDTFVSSETSAPTTAALEELLAYLEHEAENEEESSWDGGEEKEIDDDTELTAGDVETFKSEDGPERVQALMIDINAGDLDLNPPWQRDDVWPISRRRNLIRSLLVGIPLPAIILHKRTDGLRSVLDGKQRLTTIQRYIDGEFALGQFESGIAVDGQQLASCSKKRFDELPDWARRTIEKTRLYVVQFESMRPNMLYTVFELYNTSGTTLNAVEIRNAVFHDDPIHRMAFCLAGDKDGEVEYYLPKRIQSAFTQQLRDVVGNRKPPTRYAATDFIERYLAYSRTPARGSVGSATASRSPLGFSRETTAKIARLYLTIGEDRDRAAEVAAEIVEVWQLAIELYLQFDDKLPFLEFNRSGKLRFHRLRATTSLVACRLLRGALNGSKISKDDAVDVLRRVERKVPLPEKQQSRSIWEHQAAYIMTLLSTVPAETRRILESDFEQLITNMRWLNDHRRSE
jgi:hypothetical protein